jgi:hypothetical protein
MKAVAKKQVDQRTFEEHGVLPKAVNRNYSLESRKEPSHIKIKRPKDLDLSEIAIEDD